LNPLQDSGSYSAILNKCTGTLVLNEWVVTFCCEKRGQGVVPTYQTPPHCTDCYNHRLLISCNVFKTTINYIQAEAFITLICSTVVPSIKRKLK